MIKMPYRVRRFNTTSGRYYGPDDLDLYNSVVNPLKPSWTNIASIESSPGLDEYFKNTGRWSNILGPTTAIIGTITHDFVDDLNHGLTVTTDDIIERLENYQDIRWRLVYHNKFQAVEVIKKQLTNYTLWYDDFQPDIVGSEIMLWHENVEFAGTCDLLLKTFSKQHDKEIYMVADLKTGNEMDKHFTQCMAYAILIEQIFKIKVSALGILYCQGRNKGDIKPGKLKTKMIRTKNGSINNNATLLSKKVTSLVDLFKSNIKYEQPKMKKRLQNRFQLKINKKEDTGNE